MLLIWESEMRRTKFLMKLESLNYGNILIELKSKMTISKAIMPLGDRSVLLEILMMISDIGLVNWLFVIAWKRDPIVSESYFLSLL